MREMFVGILLLCASAIVSLPSNVNREKDGGSLRLCQEGDGAIHAPKPFHSGREKYG
jgi:hypothetical protein